MNKSSQSPLICLRCIGDEDLRAQVETGAAEVTCTFCGGTAAGLAVRELAQQVDETLRSVLRVGETSTHFDLESDKSYYEQGGDDLALYVQELLDIDENAAEAVVDALIDADPEDPRDGGEPFFTHGQLYEYAESVDWEFAETWREFSETLKHDQRFFGRSIAGDLARILGAPGSPEAADLPSFLLREGESSARLFRARRATSEGQARQFLSDPQRQLSASKPELATAGRMNPAGISVFYGATSEDAAVAEVRPSVGSLVAVGSFLPVRPLRLLDLTQLRAVRFSGSVFAPGYEERVSRAQFLRGFHQLIVQPVQQQDEPLEYLPTQAVAEYVRNSLRFDGILYASTQVGALYEEERPLSEGATTPPPASNAVIFGISRREYHSEPWSVPTIRGTITEHPLKYDDGSAHIVRVGSVRYEMHRVEFDDARDGSVAEINDF